MNPCLRRNVVVIFICLLAGRNASNLSENSQSISMQLEGTWQLSAIANFHFVYNTEGVVNINDTNGNRIFGPIFTTIRNRDITNIEVCIDFASVQQCSTVPFSLTENNLAVKLPTQVMAAIMSYYAENIQSSISMEQISYFINRLGDSNNDSSSSFSLQSLSLFGQDEIQISYLLNFLPILSNLVLRFSRFEE